MLLRRRYPAKDEGKDKDYMKNTEQILIRVPLEMKQAMQKLAAAERRDLANYIRILFEDTIEKHRAANQGASLSDSSAKICYHEWDRQIGGAFICKLCKKHRF